jgi:hypothetical protein
MDLARLSDGDLLDRRNEAFLRVSGALPSHPDRAQAYQEIRLINRELQRRRSRTAVNPPSQGRQPEGRGGL